MHSRLRGKQHKSPLVGSGLYCESTLGASVPTAVCFACFSRTFSHLTILTLKITTRECRQIAEQSPHRALSFWISLLCCFLLWELLGDVVVRVGGEGKILKVLHVARTRNSTKYHSPLFLFKWIDSKSGLLLK